MDIRWIQSLDSYKKALSRLNQVISEKKMEELSELEQEGLIQRFEYTTRLAWKTLKKLLKAQGYADEEIGGPMPVLRLAYSIRLLQDHDGWRKMFKARNTTSHIYSDGEVSKITRDIYETYTNFLLQLKSELEKSVNK